MVQRYTSSYKRPLYKDSPFYYRHVRRLQYIAGIGFLSYIFVPQIYAFLFPPAELTMDAINPRCDSDVRELKKKLAARAKDLDASPLYAPPIKLDYEDEV